MGGLSRVSNTPPWLLRTLAGLAQIFPRSAQVLVNLRQAPFLSLNPRHDVAKLWNSDEKRQI